MNAIGYGEGNANGDGQCLHGVFDAVCLSDRQVRVDPSIKKYGRTAESAITRNHGACWERLFFLLEGRACFKM